MGVVPFGEVLNVENAPLLDCRCEQQSTIKLAYHLTILIKEAYKEELITVIATHETNNFSFYRF